MISFIVNSVWWIFGYGETPKESDGGQTATEIVREPEVVETSGPQVPGIIGTVLPDLPIEASLEPLEITCGGPTPCNTPKSEFEDSKANPSSIRSKRIKKRREARALNQLCGGANP